MDSGKWGEITDDRQKPWLYAFVEVPSKTERERKLEKALKTIKKHFPESVLSDRCGEEAEELLDAIWSI